MSGPRPDDILDLQHDDKLVRDELRPHVLSDLKCLCRRETEQPREWEQYDAEDELKRER